MSKITIVRSKPQEQSYEEFLEKRKSSIGGSDIADMLNIEPYGCKRRLYLDKLGLLPKQENSHHFERGKFLEGPIAELYGKATKRSIRPVGACYIQQYPEVSCHPDRLCERESGMMGVLEIKAPAQWAFQKVKKEGLSEAYVAQLNYEMLCAGTIWGAFAIYWADGHELIYFDLDRDSALCDVLFEAVKSCWNEIQFIKERIDIEGEAEAGLPPKKLESYAGCQRCPAFDMCHGEKGERSDIIISRPDLEAAANEYERLLRDEKLITERREAARDRFKEELKAANAKQMSAGEWILSASVRSTDRLDADAVKKILTREQLVKYTKQTETVYFTAKRIKK